MADRGKELDLTGAEEEFDLYSWKSVATLAISLLNRALIYLDGIGDLEDWEKTGMFRFHRFDDCEELHRCLTDWPKSYSCGYEEIWKFRIAVELFEDLTEKIEHQGLEKEGRISTLAKIVKAKFTSKFEFLRETDRSYGYEDWESLFLEIEQCRLDQGTEMIEYLRSEEEYRRKIDNKFARSVDWFRRRAIISLFLEKGIVKLRSLLPAGTKELVGRETGKEQIELVGRGKEKEQVVQWLIKQPAEDSEIVTTDHIRLFAILGVAGMGKTALAKLACQDPSLSTIFDFVVWVQVPYDLTPDTIPKLILENVSHVKPEHYTSKFLQYVLTGKRLLLVLDDVWADDSADKWEALLVAIRTCERGSKILLTTRMQSVVDKAAEAIGSPAECLELDELGENDNFLLFMSRLPSQVYSEDYTDLRLIGEQIAERTGGCPLVTENVASWLGSHMETRHWNAVLQNGWQKMGLGDVFASLRLSYDRLPSELQNCFRYCSIFPKGHKFNKVELANMWISSGLIPYRSSEQDDSGLRHKEDGYLVSAEDVGEQYFTALVRKSFFFHKLETDPSDENMREYYLLHSLMHDCAQFISQNECARVDDGNFQHVKSTTTHLSIASCDNLTEIPCLRHLRTLIIQSKFCLDEEAEIKLEGVLQSSKRLRMLYLDVSSLSHALDRISDLTQLRYLFLFSCGMSHIQRVFKLYRLQVFKLNYFTGKEANLDGIQNLRSLRCLHVPHRMLSKGLQIGISTTLQELHVFEVAENDGHKLSALGTFTNLQRLSLRHLQNVRNCKEAIEIKLKDKPHLRFLSLSWNKQLNDPENLDHQIIDSLEPNRGIKQLHIYGYSGIQLPVWIVNSLLIHLISLELEYCTNWMTLPSFRVLNSLKYLRLENLFQLGAEIEEQHRGRESEVAFLPPLLNTLIIRWCPSLKKLPVLPYTLEKLIIKHVGLAVLPMIHQVDTGTCESSAVNSRLSLLHIESCAHLTSLDGLLEQQQNLHYLKTLVVRHCEKLCHLPAKGFTELHHLNFLEIVSCPLLRNVKSEGNLLPMSLKNLDINPCGYIEDSVLMSLQNLTSLRRLTLFSCSNIEKLPSEEVFRTLKNLNDVSITRCKNLLSLGGLGAAVSLRVLSILCCNKIHPSYDAQVSCSFKLYKLKVDRQALLLVEPIRSLRYTMELHIGDDYLMEFLSEEWLLRNASSLRSIKIGVVENLQNLPSQMKRLESLQSLHIERAPLIQFLPELPASLCNLTIRGCDPRFRKIYETDVGSDWEKIKNIAHVDMKAYSEVLDCFFED
uniref:Uncharacterized protein n=1 Tax=Oryza glumipatula TaxID=40148 RepID=A0A0E0BT98_9ORYZ